MENQNLQQSTNHGGQTTHRNNLVSHLMRTLLFLAIMVMGAGNAWGDVSLGKATIEAIPSTTSSELTVAADKDIISAKGDGYTTETSVGVVRNDMSFVKLTGTGYFKIRVNKGSVKAGDILIVKVAGYYDEQINNGGFYVVGSPSNTEYTGESASVVTLEHTLIADNIKVDDEDSQYDMITIKRSINSSDGSNSGRAYHSFEIVKRHRAPIINLDCNQTINAVIGIPVTLTAHATEGDNNPGVIWKVSDDAIGTNLTGDSYYGDSYVFTPERDGTYYFCARAHETCRETGYWETSEKIIVTVNVGNGFTINWTSGDIPSGCDAWFTLGDDATEHRESVSGVAAGTVIHLRATDSGNNAKIISNWTFGSGGGLWTNPAIRDIDNWTGNVVDGVLNIQPHFADAYIVRAVMGDRCATVSVTGKKGSNSPVEINGIKQIVDLENKYSLTFTATGESDYIFDGWYNGDTKISPDATYSYGEYTPSAGSVLTYTAKYHPANRVNITVEPAELNPAINIYFHGHHDGCIHETGASWGSIGNGANVGPGTSIDVSVGDVTDYVFAGWYENETLKSNTQTDYAYGNVYGGCNLVAKFVPAGSDGIVTFSSENNELGTVTATVDASDISTGTNVTGGSTVTFTATPSGSNVFWRWQEYREDAWHDIVGATATYNKRIDGNFTIKAIFSEPKTFTASTPLSTYGNVKITKNGVDQGTSYDSAPYPQGLKFVATANPNYSFVAWYSSDTFAEDKKVSTDAEFDFSGTSGNTDIKNNGGTLYAKFVRSSNVTPKPDCGTGHYFDQSKLVAGGGAALTITDCKGTVTTTSPGYVSFFFAEGYNLTELNRWAVGNTNNDNVDYVAFCKNGAIVRRSSDNKEMLFNYSAHDRTLAKEYADVLTSVDEIRIGFKASTTTTINYFTIETKPDVMYKVPTLAAPTTNEMTIWQGETLNLRITDTNGYWREYTNDSYDVTKPERIGNGEYSPSYDFAELPNGDYYFGIKHGGNCKLGHYHTTDLVKVHVKVRKRINTIEVNGQSREYDVYAPDGITGEVGVVFSLHGASNDYDNGRVDFNGIADEEKETAKKFVVVYPRGLMRQLRGTERGWETYTESNMEDVEFFKAIVTDLKKTYSVDMNRIYLAGFSNGGMMAYKAAHQAADFFAAFASVGGYPVNESHLFHAGKQPTPFVHIQGKADGIFPNSTYPFYVITHNMVYRNGAKFNPNETDAYEKNDGGMVTSPKDGEGNDIIEKDCHAAVEGGAAYYMYKVAGMGHTWTYDWDNDGNDDVAATMWKFFNKSAIKVNVDPTLKFRLYDTNVFWGMAGQLGFDNVNTGTSVLSYGGRTKTSTNSDTYNKDSNNKNLWHSLQFQGGINGAAHFLKLNVHTEDVGGAQNEVATDYFIVRLTKTGSDVPVFSKRYQAGRGTKDLYINFSALPGFNEYKLEITKSRSDLVVTVHGVEFHTGRCDDLKDNEGNPLHTENPTFFFDVEDMLSKAGMKPIYQPRYDKSYDGLAKEYLPIADIPVGGDPKTVEDALKKDKTAITNIPSTLITTWTDGRATLSATALFNLAHSGKEGEITNVKSNNAYIYVPVGGAVSYPVDRVKGINISANGRAEMPEYLNGTRGDFPDRGVIAIKVEGTVDFTLLAQNDIDYPGNDANAGRSTLKVYYTNDQMNNELKELKEWWFFGTRHEGWINDNKAYTDHPNGNSMSPLAVNVRLPQLGKDGTCTLFITYEGRRNDDHTFTHPDGTPSVYDGADDADKMWIKGFVIKRPDLKVTIGRTDNEYHDQKYNGEDNTFCTHFGNNKPYIWNFENVGFDNTKYADLGEKKINVKDGRTYVCGNNTNDAGDLTDMDHLLLYSDTTLIKDGAGNIISLENKVQFDGRVPGQEHIEFRKASVYNIPTSTTSRCIFDPIQSNGLKVNVTGSGWFKIKCSAPNGPVNMKVYSSTNYGASYINLLREFRVEKTASETDWHEYTVYLKGHVNRIPEKEKAPENRRAQKGFWDGDYANAYDEGAEEILRMSLFVVFDEINDDEFDGNYDESHPQLNIHELSWLNEKPADYVFQREEDPNLLTTWQAIRRNGETVLWWKTGNDDDDVYPMLKENGVDTYNRLGQFTTKLEDDGHNNIGEKSPVGYASTSVPSDAGTYEAYWDIAAPASTGSHTEKAYANRNTAIGNESPQYVKTGNNTEFDMPISGSFVRICAMKNTYVVAHVLPGVANGNVYVLDETGSPIGFDGSTDDGKIRGYIATMSNVTGSGVDRQSTDGTVRIDFCANAGKEYFICAKDASISLARLEVVDNMYAPAKAAETLALTDNANNSTAINTAYSSKEFYRNATLARKLTKGSWVSLVLPFSMNEKKFKEVFGDNARCIHFSGMDFDSKLVKLTHHYYNMIVAGRPVFVRPDIDILKTSPLAINDITLQANSVNSTEVETANGTFTFTGSYDMQPIVQNDLFINNNQMTYLNIASSSYPGMRSFIQNGSHYDFETNTTPSQPVGAKAMFLEFFDTDEDVPTEIMEIIGSEFGKNVVVVTKSTKVYDLNGRVVAEGANISNLPAGIYIVNGKKYIVK